MSVIDYGSHLDTREFLRANIAALIAAFDEHEAHINRDGSYQCAKCPQPMTPAEWEQHLADAIAEKLAPAQGVLDGVGL